MTFINNMMKQEGGIIYPSFPEAMEAITKCLKDNDAISFQKISTPDSTKGYLFSAQFYKQDVSLGMRLYTRYFYVKWETSRAYGTISKEHEGLANAKDGGKTFNVKTLKSLDMYQNMTLIFADPYAIHVIDKPFFEYNSHEFKQEFNGEHVLGIDINKLSPIDRYFGNKKGV